MKISNILFRIPFFLVAFLFTGNLIHQPPVLAEEKTKNITVIGQSQMRPDIAAAKNEAVGNALLSAVENAAIGEFPLSVITEKFQSIGSLLAERKDEFIVEYRVLQENKADKQYRVLVSATVSLDKLQQALSAGGIIATIEKMPQVLVLIAEKFAGDTEFKYWWQNRQPVSSETSGPALKEILASKGFPIINQQLVPSDFFNDLQLAAELTDDEAIDLGKRMFADVVIVGTAQASETPNRMGENIKTIKGAVTVRVIFPESGEKTELIQDSATAADSDAARGSQKALSDATRQAGDKICSQMLAKWQEIQKPTGEITLHLTGRNILANLNEFRNALKNTSGVTNQRTLEIAPDKAVLSVSYQGESKVLADAILLQSFKGFGVNIYEITPKNLNIELTAR